MSMANYLLSQVAPLAATASLALIVGIYLLVGLLIALFARLVARGLLRLGRLVPSYRRPTNERLRTLEGLIASWPSSWPSWLRSRSS
jgi:hypothetical protein